MLAKRLKELREAKGVSQEEVAAAVGLARLSVSNYERGTRTPDADILAKLAKFYAISSDYLIGQTDERIDHERDILEVTGLSKEAFERLCEFHRYGHSEWLNKIIVSDNFFTALDTLTNVYLHYPRIANEEGNIVRRYSDDPKNDITIPIKVATDVAIANVKRDVSIAIDTAIAERLADDARKAR